ncbi:hypothetical protein JYU34_013109 [Plutella xylostella]|uniref:Uncharacterized protein n=1 Tax=Plutella xylostella TaxID=51655 RepID=A0ABQ7QCZ3_PLUXY|nr:hypothetical protein JYU34_013109 [Plutella xylostella]
MVRIIRSADLEDTDTGHPAADSGARHSSSHIPYLLVTHSHWWSDSLVAASQLRVADVPAAGPLWARADARLRLLPPPQRPARRAPAQCGRRPSRHLRAGGTKRPSGVGAARGGGGGQAAAGLPPLRRRLLRALLRADS